MFLCRMCGNGADGLVEVRELIGARFARSEPRGERTRTTPVSPAPAKGNNHPWPIYW
jgi:hypothetical protein